MSPANSESFTPSFPIWVFVISFSSLIVMDRKSKTMLNNSGESGQYSVAQSELTQIHGERAQLPLLDGKSVKKSTATFNLPRDCVYILELMCRLNELKHIKCLGNDDCSQCPTSLVFSHCF